jgi:hypothetical protein
MENPLFLQGIFHFKGKTLNPRCLDLARTPCTETQRGMALFGANQTRNRQERKTHVEN